MIPGLIPQTRRLIFELDQPARIDIDESVGRPDLRWQKVRHVHVDAVLAGPRRHRVAAPYGGRCLIAVDQDLRFEEREHERKRHEMRGDGDALGGLLLR